MKRIITSLTALLATTAFAQDATMPDSVFNTIELTEVHVTAPSKTRMKDGAMVTRIVASALSEAGNAEDVLSRVPGMIRQQGELQVIGKGKPTYYVNGRKVHDLSELQRIASQDIKDVQVINNPGAEYDAQTNAVVKIRTLRQKGEGIGVNLHSKEEYSPAYGNNIFSSTLGINYRHNSLDMFGGATFDANSLKRYATVAENESFTVVDGKQSSFRQAGNTCLKQRNNSLRYNLGFNYQVSDNHSFGMRIERTDNLLGSQDFSMNDDIYHNGSKIDYLSTDTHTDSNGVNSWLGNIYYNGTAAGFGIDLNLDYYNTDERRTMTTAEQAGSGPRSIVSVNEAKNNLFATKLVLSHPLGKGTLKGGTELAFVNRNSIYDITEENIPNDNADVKENTYAAFLEYGLMIPKAGQLGLGVRYEHSDFTYTNSTNSSLDLHRTTDNIFPFINFGTRIGELATSVSYSVSTRRPGYSMLRNNVEYNNRFTLSTGDPTLRNEIRHQAGINAQWRWVSGTINYLCQKDGIYDWTYPYGKDNDGTIMLTWVNLSKPVNRLSAFVNLSPTVGIWSPSYTIGIQKQWLELELTDPRTSSGKRTVTYNKPMYIFNANNAFRLPTKDGSSNGAWQFELNSEFYTSSHYGNAELLTCYWNLTAAIQKTFLKDDALSVRLSFSDIFHTAYNDVRLDFGNYLFKQTNIGGEGRTIYDPQRIALNVRYKFNAVKSKYKGTGAGNDIRQRM